MEGQRFSERLAARIDSSGSHLCVGLDPRLERHGGDLLAVESFLRGVIEETAEHAAAFKPNSAYFEACGSDGVAVLEQVLEVIPDEVPVILDVKRSDIGATQERYAEACFERWGADAATLNPFMGYDSIEPFLGYPGRGVYLLAVTSNPGSADIQQRESGGRRIFEYVGEFAERARREGSATDVGLVVGLTNAGGETLGGLPDVPLLVPGLGAQGGNLAALAGTGRTAPTVVNVSRGVLYGDGGTAGSRAAAFRAQIAAALD